MEVSHSLIHFIQHFNFTIDASELTPLEYHYQLPLVAVSFFIATLAGYTGLSITDVMRQQPEEPNRAWLILGSLVLGLGVWAMHFIAMLAYQLEILITYDVLITGISVIPAILASFVVLQSMLKNHQSMFWMIKDGLIIGAGIGAMHYIGMGAMVMEATSSYYLPIFGLSIVVAWVLGCLLLYVHFYTISHAQKIVHQLISAIIFGCAVCGMHYTGMAAVSFYPLELTSIPPSISTASLGFFIALVVLLLIIALLVIIYFQQRIYVAEEDALINRAHLIEAIEGISDGFILTDSENRITLSNQPLKKLFPSAEGLVSQGQSISDFIEWFISKKVERSPVLCQQTHQQLLALKSFDKPLEIQLRDQRWLLIRQRQIKSGAVMRIWSDISPQKQAAESLINEEKMQSLGRMVSGVAHEVNTPLGISLTIASQLAEETADVRKHYDNDEVSQQQFEHYLQHCEEISELLLANIRRASELIRNFKQVAVDQSNLQQETVNLLNYTQQIISTLRSEYKQLNPAISIKGDESIDSKTYPGAYAQVIINLLKNSLLHAFQDIEKPSINIDIQQQGQKIIICYADNGIGMTDEVADKLFEPFFTTKRNAGGTGLGMYVVYNLVTQKLEGSIHVDSQPQQGTKFTIELPMNIIS